MEICSFGITRGFHVHGGYYLFMYLMTTGEQCWKINKPSRKEYGFLTSELEEK